MTLYDTYEGREYKLSEIKDRYSAYRNEDPRSVNMTFALELPEIISDTLNGLTDFQIIGMTLDEINGYTKRLYRYNHGPEDGPEWDDIP